MLPLLEALFVSLLCHQNQSFSNYLIWHTSKIFSQNAMDQYYICAILLSNYNQVSSISICYITACEKELYQTIKKDFMYFQFHITCFIYYDNVKLKTYHVLVVSNLHTTTLSSIDLSDQSI